MIRQLVSAAITFGVAVSGVSSLTSSRQAPLPPKAQVLKTEPDSAHVYVKWVVGEGSYPHPFTFRPVGTKVYTIYFSCSGPGKFGFVHIGSTTTCFGAWDSLQSTFLNMSEFTLRVFASPRVRWELQMSSGKPRLLAPPCRLPKCISYSG